MLRIGTKILDRMALVTIICGLFLSPVRSWAISQDLDDCGTITSPSPPLPYWRNEFARHLTARLTAEDIEALQKVESHQHYLIWLNELAVSGWSEKLITAQDFDHMVFKAYDSGQIDIHQLFTGVTFRAAWKQTGAPLRFFKIDLSNVDTILKGHVTPLHPGHYQMVRSRVLMLPESERVVLYLGSFWPRMSLLDGIFFTGDHAEPPIDARNSNGKSYDLFPPPASVITWIIKNYKAYYRGSILSSSIRQIVSDVIHGERSTQSVPVLGKESSLQMAELISLGGRSVSIAMEGIQNLEPHGLNPSETPLSSLLHDYYHNEFASQTSRQMRIEVVPYLLKLLRPYSNQITSFLERLTDFDDTWRSASELVATLSKEVAADNKSQKTLQEEKNLVLSVIKEDLTKNPLVWARWGLDLKTFKP